MGVYTLCSVIVAPTSRSFQAVILMSARLKCLSYFFLKFFRPNLPKNGFECEVQSRVMRKGTQEYHLNQHENP